ncbi:hypothetical protein CANARDRAFT_27926 [[Candida] arabinofermentans NRRL YB-2248]|uniref:PCI domain-containing protein n=1 Tax=[Candida] arabinofermentans NRRL YB-2248 TaxID=983967 RepID=A0A1E4T279_9ASCO|nr:hypothetical protein CANARDRAFT_27926 [[Candida] arabinofermentans NRRL YB-2248]
MSWNEKDILHAFEDLNCNNYNYIRNSLQFNDQTSQLLELFAFGNLEDYYENETLFKDVTFNDLYLLKLRQLTLMSLAAESRIISFELIKSKLYLDSTNLIPELLKLTTGTQKLIRFKIDELNETIYIKHVKSRNIFISNIDKPLTFLNSGKVKTIDEMISFLVNFKDNKLKTLSSKIDKFEKQTMGTVQSDSDDMILLRRQSSSNEAQKKSSIIDEHVYNDDDDDDEDIANDDFEEGEVDEDEDIGGNDDEDDDEREESDSFEESSTGNESNSRYKGNNSDVSDDVVPGSTIGTKRRLEH